MPCAPCPGANSSEPQAPGGETPGPDLNGTCAEAPAALQCCTHAVSRPSGIVSVAFPSALPVASVDIRSSPGAAGPLDEAAALAGLAVRVRSGSSATGCALAAPEAAAAAAGGVITRSLHCMSSAESLAIVLPAAIRAGPPPGTVITVRVCVGDTSNATLTLVPPPAA